jgi:hypothetical protein
LVEAGPDDALKGILEDPDQEQVEEAEQKSQEAVEQAFGAEEDRDRYVGLEHLKKLVEELDYDLPPLESLAGDVETRVNERMKLAESALIAGKYLTAESLYQRVLIDAPNMTMARVGLVHAQLGGGLIRSAAFNLRLLFEEHPELIATHYAENLLPNGSRLQWVQNELQKMITDANSPGDAGLMLAYLGHQVGSRQLVRYGLAVTEADNPNDALVPLLRQIWLGDKGDE